MNLMNTELLSQSDAASSNNSFTAKSSGIEEKRRKNVVNTKSERCAIVVLGMHRSGTSALTRTLSLLGIDLPKNLMQPVQGNNETGFWESIDVYHLNDEILRSADSHWSDWNKFQQENLSPAEVNYFKVKAYDILKNNHDFLPENAKRFYDYMTERNILFHYSSLNGIETVLTHLSGRIRNRYELQLAVPILEANYQEIEEEFTIFFSDLEAFCKKQPEVTI